MASRAIMYRPASSVLVAEDITFLWCVLCSVLPHCLVGQLYCLKGRSVRPLGFVLLACSSSWHCCVLLAPCRLHGRRVRRLLAWPDNRRVVVFVALCLQLVWMIVILWHWLGKEGCYQLLCKGIETCRIPVGWTTWPCCLTVAPLILVLRIVSLRHIGLVNFGMVHAVVCLLCVEIVSNLLNVVWHGQMNLALVAAPIQCYPNVSFACPIARKFVVFFKCVFEMLCMFFTDVCHAEVINNQCELYWSCVMLPKARYQLALLVSVFVEMFFEEFVGQ